jgi:hypothetical protein
MVVQVRSGREPKQPLQSDGLACDAHFPSFDQAIFRTLVPPEALLFPLASAWSRIY